MYDTRKISHMSRCVTDFNEQRDTAACFVRSICMHEASTTANILTIVGRKPRNLVLFPGDGRQELKVGLGTWDCCSRAQVLWRTLVHEFHILIVKEPILNENCTLHSEITGILEAEHYYTKLN